MEAQGKNAPAARPAARAAFRAGFAVCLAAVTVLALWPGVSPPPRPLGHDKIEHALAFAALAFLARQAFPRLTAGAAGLGGLALTLTLYGAGIEWLQGLEIVGRTRSLADIAANSIGVALGLLAAAVWNRLIRL